MMKDEGEKKTFISLLTFVFISQQSKRTKGERELACVTKEA